MYKLNLKIKNLYKTLFIESKYYLLYPFIYESICEFIYLLYEWFVTRQVRINRILQYKFQRSPIQFLTGLLFC